MKWLSISCAPVRNSIQLSQPTERQGGGWGWGVRKSIQLSQPTVVSHERGAREPRRVSKGRGGYGAWSRSCSQQGVPRDGARRATASQQGASLGAGLGMG